MKQILLLISLFIFPYSYAQTPEPCGHKAYIDYLNELQPGFKSHYNQIYHRTVEESQLKNKFEKKDTLHTIKVVFHVVYNNVVENLHDSLIYSQMDVLNECFRRQNADTISTRDIFLDVAGDAGIEFELADTDPDGNPTTGIVRQLTTVRSFLTSGINIQEADAVKFEVLGSPAWNTEKYLNIWICDLSVQGQDLLLGYAFPPTNAAFWGSNSFVPANRQGVVLHYKVVGEGNRFSLSTGAKTAVHEVGHYLGLRHTWGDAPNFNRCAPNYDDFIWDTPLSGTSSSASGCNLNKNTCNRTEPGDLPDLIENYMDYAPGQCQNMFTNGQIDVMRNNLTTFRSEVYRSEYPPVPPVLEPGTPIGVYPNPVKDKLAISLSSVDTTNTYSIRIVSLLGQEMVTIPLEQKESQLIEYQFGFKGLFLYQIVNQDGVAIKEERLTFIN